jgi:hypothetical protein
LDLETKVGITSTDDLKVSKLKPEMRLSKVKIVTIHQPDFLPWLGFFDRWRRSDLYVMLDNVQFLRRGWHHRDKIKSANGLQWLTLPVRKKGKNLQLINEVELDNDQDWKRKHLSTIQHAYAKAPCFDEIFPAIETIYKRASDLMIDLNVNLLKFASERLGISVPTVLASEFEVNGRGTTRLVELTKMFNAKVYLTGTGARDYLDESEFQAEGIKVEWQHFEHPCYTQLHGDFVPMLSVLDYLMNERARHP